MVRWHVCILASSHNSSVTRHLTFLLPSTVHSQLQKVNRARKQAAQEIGRAPTDPELAHYMEISVVELRKIVGKAQTVVSLESPVRKGTSHKAEVDQRTIGDFIASDTPTPEEDVQRVGLQNEIRAVMEELADRERKVLILRYGLENGDPMSLSQTANEIGISMDQVRLVEARALNKLRCPRRNYRLKEYVAGETQETFLERPVAEEDGDKHKQQLTPTPKLWFF